MIGIYLSIGLCCSAQGPSVPPSGNVFQFPDFSVGPQESGILIGILSQKQTQQTHRYNLKNIMQVKIYSYVFGATKTNKSSCIVFLPVAQQ